jgi:acyl-homoserine-lactone acylase
MRRSLIVALAVIAVAAGCSQSPAGDTYRAEIRRTSYNVAHIKADDMGSLGFGEGYALAQDHLCSVADQVVRSRGERSKYFGAGVENVHLLGDIGMKALGMHSGAADDLALQSPEVREWLAGYVAGYNKYLRETGVDNVAGWCRGQDWVFEIATQDLVAYVRSFVHVSPNFVAMIASAAPPSATTDEATAGGAMAAAFDPDVAGLKEWDDRELKGASNGWGIGRDRAEKGRGMLVANPHYPWLGSNRFWEKHLTVPGELDVYGVGLLGVPGVAIGFNSAVAWTHTVSAGERFTLYRLALAKGDPMTYLYDGEERALEPRTVEVEVKQEDGSIETIEHTSWWSHYGPIVNFPGMPWSERFAIAFRGTNEDNDEATGQWLDMDRATSMDEFQEVHAKWNAMPWVNTISTSAEGRAWYADGSSTPNLSDEAIAAWQEATKTDPMIGAAWKSGVVLLDGSDSTFEWQVDDEARDEGIVGFSSVPQIERTDYVFNANDSYWLANSSALLTGYSPMHGLEGTPRSLRTRQNDRSLSDTSASGPYGEDGKFSLDEMAAEILSNRSLTATLLKDELVERCKASSSVSVGGEVVDLREACSVLDAYDGRLELDARGAVLLREWITLYEARETRGAGRLFAVDFDPSDPVATPRGLAKGELALKNLARAVQVMERAGLALDVELGEVQVAYRGGHKIPIHGGDGTLEGVENFVRNGANRTTLEPMFPREKIEGSRYLTTDGYPVNSGSSFVMALEYTDEGPRAQAFLTYSQSGDPESVHFSDQTELFSKKAWRPIAFAEAEVAADTVSSVTVTGPRM